MESAIRIENLSKRYRLGASLGEPYQTLRESMARTISRSWGRLWSASVRGHLETDRSREVHWALKEVSFDVEPGEVLGVIGRNGAGKSTLLKILSRITEPTSGRAELRGRIVSLLEVGTGFHQELTGRENIYLNGTILGMSRREITRKFESIVEFSEIGSYLDTPVKRYSSGMYVRLAFAVASHLEAEIMIVDEVLAVGDASYQKRCIDRMAALAGSGRTVLFVSHNMDIIPRLCRGAVWLEHGRVVGQGPVRTVVEAYLGSLVPDTAEDLAFKHRTGDGRARFSKVQLIGPDGAGRLSHASGQDLVIRLEVESNAEIRDAALAVNINTLFGTRLFSGWTREAGFRVDLSKGRSTFECHFSRVRVRPGHRLSVELWMESGSILDSVKDALILEAVDGEGTSAFSTDRHQGIVLYDYLWKVHDNT